MSARATPGSTSRHRDGEPFSEQHRQYFHEDCDVRNSLQDAGFEVIAVGDEFTHDPVRPATLRATWTARRLSAGGGAVGAQMAGAAARGGTIPHGA